MNLALLHASKTNHIIYLDWEKRYFVPFKEIDLRALLHDSFYIAVMEKQRVVEKIRCRLIYIVAHLQRHYYALELRQRHERDAHKVERFQMLVREQVNRSVKNGSLLLRPLPSFNRVALRLN